LEGGDVQAPRWGEKEEEKEKNIFVDFRYHGLAPRGYYQSPLRGWKRQRQAGNGS
jgi:hypothetical protein